jgi:hypothetical protein
MATPTIINNIRGANRIGSNNFTQGGKDYSWTNPSMKWVAAPGGTGVEQQYNGGAKQISSSQWNNSGGYASPVVSPSNFGAGTGSTGAGSVTGSSAGTPSEPTQAMPSTQQLAGDYNTYYNTIMNSLNPAFNRLNQYGTAGQASLTQGEAANTATANAGINTVNQDTTNAINTQKGLATNAETGYSNAALASENAMSNQMKSGQEANIGALNAQAGAAGFSSGISAAGDPYVRAEQSAMNQPYYQQLQTLNSTTLQAIQSNVSTLTGDAMTQIGQLQQNQQTSVTAIYNNAVTQNASLYKESANLNAQIAQDYTSLVNQGTATAGQLLGYQNTLQASKWTNQQAAYSTAASILGIINTFKVNSANAVSNRMKTEGGLNQIIANNALGNSMINSLNGKSKSYNVVSQNINSLKKGG